jgi:hypothetical protein
MNIAKMVILNSTTQMQLTKMNKDIDDLELPCKIAQLIPRKLELITMRETLDIKETSRGSDGGIAR